MEAVVEGKCAEVVPQPPGFADRLFVVVLFPHLNQTNVHSPLFNLTAIPCDHSR